MGIQLSQNDFDRLASILSQHAEWQNVRDRGRFMADVFAGSEHQKTILGQLDLDGSRHSTAVWVIHWLADFGQVDPGRESLGVLINKVIAYLGGGNDADFLRGLLAQYPLTTPPVAARDVGSWHGKDTQHGVAEKIIGENTLRDIYMLEVLLDLSRGVVRVVGPKGKGTGFLIADDLLMTNHHVIDSAEAARECIFEFNYQLDRTGKELPVHAARALDGGLFRTSPIAPYNATADQLDYTVLQLRDVPKGTASFKLKAATVKPDSRVAVIQHPSGLYKKISLQNNFVEYADEYVVQYTTSTEPGSSGSPVIGDEFQAVAIHHAGGCLPQPATEHRYLRNEGIRVSAILDDLRQKAPDIYGRVAQ